jgi:hypothetical protein
MRLAPLALAAALAAGCGGGGDPPDQAVRNYLNAVVAGDGAEACDQLTDDLRADIDKAGVGGGCEELMSIAKQLNPGLKKDDVDDLDIETSEDGDKATAKFKNPLANRDETLNLEKQDDAWKIATLVTRPQ